MFFLVWFTVWDFEQLVYALNWVYLLSFKDGRMIYLQHAENQIFIISVFLSAASEIPVILPSHFSSTC